MASGKARPYSGKQLARERENFVDRFHDPLDETFTWRLLATLDERDIRIAMLEREVAALRLLNAAAR